MSKAYKHPDRNVNGLELKKQDVSKEQLSARYSRPINETQGPKPRFLLLTQDFPNHLPLIPTGKVTIRTF